MAFKKNPPAKKKHSRKHLISQTKDYGLNQPHHNQMKLNPFHIHLQYHRSVSGNVFLKNYTLKSYPPLLPNSRKTSQIESCPCILLDFYENFILGFLVISKETQKCYLSYSGNIIQRVAFPNYH